MSTITPASAQANPKPWTPCSFPGHLDAVRDLHEDLAVRVLSLPPGLITANPDELAAYLEAVAALLDHLAGKHADGCLVELAAESA